MEPAIADYVTSFYTMTTTPTVVFHFCPTKKMLAENLPSGMTVATDMGTLEGTDSYACNFPPPPPPAKAVGEKGAPAVSVSMTAAGAVSDYDDGKKAELECNMAALVDVSCDKVTVSVTAGSVILDFTIIAADTAAAAAVEATLTTAISTPSAASAALGVTIEAAPTITSVTLMPPPSPPEDGLSTGAIVGIAVGAGVGVLVVIGVVVMLLKKKKKSVMPKEHAPK
jgi:hypothetical protein